MTSLIPGLGAILRWRANPEDTVTADALWLNPPGVPVAAKSADYTLTNTDHTILMTAGASTKTTTLPTAVGISGREYVLKKVDAGVGVANLATTSAQTIDGAASPYTSLSAQWKYVRVVSDGANWLIVGAG